MHKLGLGIVCSLLVIALGCNMGPKSSRGFTLPDGDKDRGRETYIKLQCNACHAIEGVEQLASADDEPELSVSLGGEVPRIKTYGELVTAIINPSHRLANSYQLPEGADPSVSPMKNYNDVMTVTELINLVAYLQSHYELIEYEPSAYPPYGY